MKNSIVFTIIIPSYNNAMFVLQAIESILSQPLAKNIQIIVVDDGSIDNTFNACLRYNGVENFLYLKTENLGAGHARNTGIRYALGDWIIFLDSDDLIAANSFTIELATKMDCFMKNGIEVVYCACSHGEIDLNSIPEIHLAVDNQKRLIPQVSFWANIYNSSFLKNNPACRFYEYRQQDIETAFRYIIKKEATKCSIDNQICFYIHRNNPDGNINTINYEMLYGIKTLVYYDLFSKYGDDEMLKEAVYLIYKYFRTIINKKFYSDKIIWRKVNYLLSKRNNIMKSAFKKYLGFKRLVYVQFFKLFMHHKKMVHKKEKECNDMIDYSFEFIKVNYFTFCKNVEKALMYYGEQGHEK